MKNKKISILIADDDLDDQEFIKVALREVSPYFESSAVYNGIQLLDFICRRNVYKNIQENVDLIILDLNMPKMNGWEILQYFKEEEILSRIPIFIFSTSSIDTEISKALALGATRYYTKPNDPQKYKLIIEDIIRCHSETALENSLKLSPVE